MPKPTDKAQSILNRICYATLATVSVDGQPWNSPVYCAYDENYHIYWRSPIDSQHSQNIRANGKVFVVVYDSTVAWGSGKGVYIQAVCTELNDEAQITASFRAIQAHRPIPQWKLEEVRGNAPRRLYKAIPQKIWINGDGEKDGQYVDVRLEAEA